MNAFKFVQVNIIHKQIVTGVLLYIGVHLFAQNFDYKKFTTSNGLMSNQTDALYLDSKGMLWIANGNGITRYNGKNFVNYLNDSMLTVVNKINAFSIKELKDGSIFYSMKYGYVKTSDKKKYYLDIYLSDTIALDGEEGVTDKNGIRYFKSGILDFDIEKNKIHTIKFKNYPDGYKFPSNLLCSNLGSVFYSFYNKENDTRTLYLYSENKFQKVCGDIDFIMAGILENDKNYFIIPDEFNSSNPIIIVSKKNLSKAYIFKNKDIPDLNLFGNGLFYADNIVLSASSGILIIDITKKQIFAADDVIKKMNTSDDRFFSSLKKPMYLYNNYILNGYRLLDVQKNKITVPDVIEKQMSNENFINEAMPDEEGNLWYATYNGLFQVFPLPYEYLYSITESRIGEINDSVQKAQHRCLNTFEKIEYCLTNDSEKIQILIPEIKDKFYKYDIATQKISPIYVQGLQSPVLKERLYPILSYKKLLICQEYTRGLVVYHLSKNIDTAYYHLFSYSNGLLSNYVENIFVDKNENVWFFTWDGIQMIHYNDLLNENYDKSTKYTGSFKLDMIPFMKEDNIYFADGSMMYKISTSKILYNKKIPVIVIEKIILKQGNTIQEIKFQQDSIYQIPYNFDELDIEFFAVCLSDGAKVKYKYVLDNSVHFQNEGNLMISDLNPGKHVIEIFACNNFNIWTPHSVRFQLEVLPPFWETWWFRTASVSIIIGLVILTMRKREYDLKKRQQELERLVNIRTKELAEKNQLIEQKNTEILDSINYTKRLQQSSLPSESELRKNFTNIFLFYQPRDIISGDFYFSSTINTNDKKQLKGISVGDCTGHGVPGAFMSILLLAYIKQSLNEKDVNSPAEALEFISKKIQKVLEYKNKNDEVKDSADMVFAVIDEETNTLWCACANNPVYIVRNSELIEIPAQKRTVGYSDNSEPFINHTFHLQKNDMIYMFSDGYADQFGNKNQETGKEKKFTKKRFKQLLVEISQHSLEKQKEILQQTHLEWRGDCEQTDDVCIVGIRV